MEKAYFLSCTVNSEINYFYHIYQKNNDSPRVFFFPIHGPSVLLISMIVLIHSLVFQPF